jgi:hypothetical protein
MTETLLALSPDSPLAERLAHMEAEISTLTTALKDIQARVDVLESNR